MNFIKVDQYVDNSILYAETNNEKFIEYLIEEGHYTIEKKVRWGNYILRNLSYVENHPPYARMNFGMPALTYQGFKDILSMVPNVKIVEVIEDGSPKLKIEVYSGFDKRFKGNKQLEGEFEYDVKRLLNHITPMSISLRIRFFHYYL